MDGRRGFPRNRGGRSRGQRGHSPRIPAPQPSRSRGNAATNQQSPGNERSPGQGSTGFRSPFNQARQWRSPPVPDIEDDSWSSHSGFSRNRGGRSPGQRGHSPRIPSLQPSRSRGNAANNQRSPSNGRSPGQGNTGFRSPFNQAGQWRSPSFPDIEDISWRSPSEFMRNRGGRSRGRRGQRPRIPAPQPSRSRGNTANYQQSPGNGRSPGQGNTGFRSPFNQAGQWRSPRVPDFEGNVLNGNSEFSRNRGGRSPGRGGQSPRIPAPQPSSSRGNAANNQQSPGNERSPGQGNTGFRSPFNEAEQYRDPPGSDFEDDTGSGSSGRSHNIEDYDRDDISTCESNCDCMLCFAEAAGDGLRNVRDEQAESVDGSRNVDQQLNLILNKIPLPFVKIWHFLNVVCRRSSAHFSTVMQGYIRIIEAALGFAVSAEDIESRLNEVMRRKARELPRNTDYFDVNEPLYGGYGDDHEEDGDPTFVVPTVILRFAFDLKNKVPLKLLGRIIALMMIRQANYHLQHPGEIDQLVHEHTNGFLEQYEKYVEHRQNRLRKKIIARIQATRQEESPKEQENLDQPQNVEQRQRPAQLLPPNWRARIPELPVELRYMMAMVQDYERDKPYVLSRTEDYNFEMYWFRYIIEAYCLKMLRDCLHVSLEDIQYDDEGLKEEIRDGILYLEMKAADANGLEAANGVLWRERLLALRILQRVPNHILELDAFMKGMHHVRKDYSTFLRYLFGGLMAEARRTETGEYPGFYEREQIRRIYLRRCEKAEEERCRRGE